jgi:hypothetical protein
MYIGVPLNLSNSGGFEYAHECPTNPEQPPQIRGSAWPVAARESPSAQDGARQIDVTRTDCTHGSARVEQVRFRLLLKRPLQNSRDILNRTTHRCWADGCNGKRADYP